MNSMKVTTSPAPAALLLAADAINEGQGWHLTDDDGDDVCGEDHDGCDCPLPIAVNQALNNYP